MHSLCVVGVCGDLLLWLWLGVYTMQRTRTHSSSRLQQSGPRHSETRNSPRLFAEQHAGGGVPFVLRVFTTLPIFASLILVQLRLCLAGKIRERRKPHEDRTPREWSRLHKHHTRDHRHVASWSITIARKCAPTARTVVIRMFKAFVITCYEYKHCTADQFGLYHFDRLKTVNKCTATNSRLHTRDRDY